MELFYVDHCTHFRSNGFGGRATQMAAEGQPVIRELRSDVVHMKASAAPPNLTRDLEATIESQRVEVRIVQTNLQATQDPLNSWDEAASSACKCFVKQSCGGNVLTS